MIISPITKEFNNASAIFDGNILKVSTGVVTREWKWTGKGFLTTVIKKNNTGITYCSNHEKIMCDWRFEYLVNENTAASLVAVNMKEVEYDPFTSPHIEVTAEIDYPTSLIKVKYIIWVYPGAPGIRTQLSIKGMDGFELAKINLNKGSCLDFIPAQCNNYIRRVVGYYNDTQHRNTRETEILREEVFKDKFHNKEVYEWANILSLERNSLKISKNDDMEGICLVKESHKCVNQVGYDTGCFECTPYGLFSTGLGLKPEDILTDRFRSTWASWSIVYSGSNEESELALKVFDRYRYPVDHERDVYIMSNTWGSTIEAADARNAARQDNAIKEIESASDLGIDVFQIDDGWQTPMNSVSSDAPSGWYPDKEKYPEGWSKVKALAKEKGITLGLWASWVISDKELIDNQKNGGFQYFKIDFAVLDTYEKIERIINNSRRVIEYSECKARINWDVTENPPRVGYFFGRDLGNIYLENRKPQEPQNVVYVPYLVLRDAWQVAKHLNLNKFQVTVQNIDMVNHDLSNAFQYNHSYCVAIALMGAPIFFQETQHLDENARNEIRPLIALYKKYRREMFEGYLFPIGDKPNDASWTGFQCHIPHKNAGYITLFRELNNQEVLKEIKLKFLQDKKLKITELFSGNENIETISCDGIATFKISRHAGFLYLRYEVIED